MAAFVLGWLFGLTAIITAIFLLTTLFSPAT
jgi:hypothetical protein